MRMPSSRRRLAVLGPFLLVVMIVAFLYSATSIPHPPTRVTQRRRQTTLAPPETEDDVVDTAPIPTSQDDHESTTSSMTRVTNIEMLNSNKYFRLQNKDTGSWLSRAIETNTDRSRDVEKVFRIQHNTKYDAYTVKGHTRMYPHVRTNQQAHGGPNVGPQF